MVEKWLWQANQPAVAFWLPLADDAGRPLGSIRMQTKPLTPDKLDAVKNVQLGTYRVVVKDVAFKRLPFEYVWQT